MSRSFVVGLDGASWHLIEPWIEAGHLPNLDQLRQTGTWATSRSCLPPVTFPNWKCYSSGKNPGKFGVYWFEHIDLRNERIDVMNGSDFQTAELWDYLNAADLRTGIVNMPTMFPPREIDGYIVAGGPDAVEGEYRSISSNYTYPSTLEQRLVDDYEYEVHPSPLLSSNNERGAEVDAILDLIEQRFRVAIDLFKTESLDFMHVTLFYLNVLHHFFWNEDPTLRAWKRIDHWLGELRTLEDTRLYLMSDHGSRRTQWEFYINEWLSDQDYLTQRRSIDDYLRTLGLTRERALSISKKLGIVDLLSEVVPQRIQELTPSSAGAKRQRKLEKIVLDRTRAVASGQGPVYLNPSFTLEPLKSDLVDDLRSVTTPDGGSLFTAVWSDDEIYEGPYIDTAPEIVIEAKPGVHINDGLGTGKILSEPDRWAAENDPNGIFVANGPGIKSQGEIEKIDIRDLFPTILTGFGVDIPTDIDGTLLPIYDTPPETELRDPIQIDPRGKHDNQRVEDRLKQLGYME